MKLWPVIFIYQKYQGNSYIYLSLNKDYMYLKYRLQWFPLETRKILQFWLFFTCTPFVFADSPCAVNKGR